MLASAIVASAAGPQGTMPRHQSVTRMSLLQPQRLRSRGSAQRHSGSERWPTHGRPEQGRASRKARCNRDRSTRTCIPSRRPSSHHSASPCPPRTNSSSTPARFLHLQTSATARPRSASLARLITNRAGVSLVSLGAGMHRHGDRHAGTEYRARRRALAQHGLRWRRRRDQVNDGRGHAQRCGGIRRCRRRSRGRCRRWARRRCRRRSRGGCRRRSRRRCGADRAARPGEASQVQEMHCRPKGLTRDIGHDRAFGIAARPGYPDERTLWPWCAGE